MNIRMKASAACIGTWAKGKYGATCCAPVQAGGLICRSGTIELVPR